MHGYLILYVNSDYLQTFFTAKTVDLLFTTAAIIGGTVMLGLPFFIQRARGIKNLLIISLLLDLIAIALLAISRDPRLIMIGFVLYRSVFFGIVVMFDVVLERFSTDESKTGSIRSLFLTLSNAVLVASPLVVSFLVGNEKNYVIAYVMSALLLVPTLLVTLKTLEKFVEPRITFAPLASIKKTAGQ